MWIHAGKEDNALGESGGIGWVVYQLSEYSGGPTLVRFHVVRGQFSAVRLAYHGVVPVVRLTHY